LLKLVNFIAYLFELKIHFIIIFIIFDNYNH